MSPLEARAQALLAAVPGAWACAVIGADGLPLCVCADEGRDGEVEAYVAELAVPLAGLGRLAVAAPAGPRGPLADLTLTAADGGHVVVRALGGAHFVALFAGPTSLSGRARYVLRISARGLGEALAP